MQALLEIVPAWQFIAFAAVFGAMWGSFANVVIVRWPLEMSVVRPASHCMSCKTPIRFHDNIPILSYLFLRGKCRRCKASFSPRYMVVELALALLAVGVMRLTILDDPPSFQQGAAEFFIWFSFVWALVTMGMIDLETYLIPDAITYPGIVVGIAANVFILELGWMEPLIAAAGGFTVIRLLFIDGYKLLTGKPGMGEGDAKLMAMFGAFLGMKGAMFALFAGAFQGLIVGVVMVAVRRRGGGDSEPVFAGDGGDPDEDGAPATKRVTRFRKAKIPFGPFLALGAIEYFFMGNAILDAYLDGIARLIGF